MSPTSTFPSPLKSPFGGVAVGEGRGAVVEDGQGYVLPQTGTEGEGKGLGDGGGVAAG